MVYAGGVGEGGMGIICIGPAKLNIDRLTLNLINCHSLTKKNIAKKNKELDSLQLLVQSDRNF